VYTALISQGVPQLGGVKQWCDSKNKSLYNPRLSRAYLPLARLSSCSHKSLSQLAIICDPTGQNGYFRTYIRTSFAFGFDFLGISRDFADLGANNG